LLNLIKKHTHNLLPIDDVKHSFVLLFLSIFCRSFYHHSSIDSRFIVFSNTRLQSFDTTRDFFRTIQNSTMSSTLLQRARSWSFKQLFIVFAAFLVYVLADGTTFSFGLFVDQLIDQYSTTNKNTAFAMSTIAALTQSVPLLLSPFVCWCTAKLGASVSSLIGCCISASGYLLPFFFDFNRTLWIPAIAYGCLLSIGLAFCYLPAYLTLPLYFEDDRGLVTGLALSGSGIGQVLLAIIVKASIIEYGWRGASLITGR
jgi:MFS family permease